MSIASVAFSAAASLLGQITRPSSTSPTAATGVTQQPQGSHHHHHHIEGNDTASIANGGTAGANGLTALNLVV
jgi:hypothetical protein